MRFLPLLITAVLAATALTTQIASACGGSYGDFQRTPRVFAVSQHIVHPTRALARKGDRAFVMLGLTAGADGKDDWSFVAPGTFDTMQVLPLPPRVAPLEVTLVGPNGARVVKTDNQVALRNGWQDKQPRLALEVAVRDGESIMFAIMGNATDAKWSNLSAGKASALTSWWLGRQGVKDVDSVTLSSVAGSGVEVVQYSSHDNTLFMLRDEDRSIARAGGRVLGSVTTGGGTYLLISVENGGMYLHKLPVPAKTLAS